MIYLPFFLRGLSVQRLVGPADDIDNRRVNAVQVLAMIPWRACTLANSSGM